MAIHRYTITDDNDLHQLVNELIARPPVLDKKNVTDVLHLIITYFQDLHDSCECIPIGGTGFNDGSGSNFDDGSGSPFTNF